MFFARQNKYSTAHTQHSIIIAYMISWKLLKENLENFLKNVFLNSILNGQNSQSITVFVEKLNKKISHYLALKRYLEEFKKTLQT